MNDDDLKPYDLSAWEAPPPPAGLADRVVARMTAADDAMAFAREHQPRRRWWVAGGIAAALVAVSLGVWIGVRATSHAPDGDTAGSGAVVADKPRALELGASSANLDAGADVRWRREGSVLHVEQRAGAATWKVGGTDQLVIDAGAAVASVEARNANVRVEVQMNMSDMRVVAGSAATAAAVALVTAVVYEGYVRVGGSHQTVVVQPGTRVEVSPGEPPREAPAPGPTQPQPLPLPPAPANGAELVVQAGESATIHVPTNNPFETQAVVQIKAACKTSMDLRIETPTNVAQDVVTLAIGRHTYEIRCDGATTPTFAGVLELVADAGTGPVIDRAPRKMVALDGRTSTLSVDGAFPVIDLEMKDTASMYRLDLERDGAPYMTLEGADPVFTLEPTALKLGTYLIRTRLDGKLGSTTKLVIQANPNAAVASIAEPKNGEHWSSPVRVAGNAIPGAQVTVSGIGIVVGDEQQHRFVAYLDPGETSTLAIRVQHPQFGLHYFLRRGAGAVATVPSHRGKPVIAILGLEPSTGNATLGQVARDLTEHLRARAKAGTGPYVMGPATDKELVDEKLLNNCESEAPACLARIGSELAADVMMFGHIEAKDSTYAVTLELLDVRTKSVLRVIADETPRSATTSDLARFGKQLYTKLTADSSSGAGCDADQLRDQGLEAEGLGQHERAVKAFEQSVACKPDAHVTELAFMASCNAGDLAKARQFWGRMKPDRRDKLVVVCERNKITRDQLDAGTTGTLVLKSTPPAKIFIDGKAVGQTPIAGMTLAPGVYKITMDAVGSEEQSFKVTIKAGETTTVAKDLGRAPPPSCDANELRDKGVEAEGLGQHARALSLFKQALRCKPDEETLQLAFMTSCNASDVASAKTLWRKLPTNVQNKLFQLCARNHILREQLDGP